MARPVKHTPTEFVRANLAHAKKTEQETGISHIAILAQAGIESAWGKAAPGNMFFGVKDNDGLNGNEQLVRTTEYHSRNDVKYPRIDSITPVVVRGQKKFKYICWDYFRKFDTPEGATTAAMPKLAPSVKTRASLPKQLPGPAMPPGPTTTPRSFAVLKQLNAPLNAYNSNVQTKPAHRI